MTAKTGVLSAIACIVLLACSPGGEGDTGDTGDTGDAGVCGDGILDPGEACDVAAPGCDAACGLTGDTAWTIQLGEANTSTTILGLAVDPRGQIVVLGETLRTPGGEPIRTTWLLALDPAGAQRWRRNIADDERLSPFQPELAVDAAGRIYVRRGGLQQFGQDGEATWYVAPTGVSFDALAVADDLVFAVGEGDADGGLILHRHDPATGELSWQQSLGAEERKVFPMALAVAGGTVAVLGHWSAMSAQGSALVTVDVATGAPMLQRFDDSDELWSALAGLPSGDLVIAGKAGEESFARRISGTGELRWTLPVVTQPSLMSGVADLAIGADETMILAVNDGTEEALHASVRAFSSAGEPAWNAEYPSENPTGSLTIRQAAFGPGFLVVAGQAEEERFADPTAWIRQIGPS